VFSLRDFAVTSSARTSAIKSSSITAGATDTFLHAFLFSIGTGKGTVTSSAPATTSSSSKTKAFCLGVVDFFCVLFCVDRFLVVGSNFCNPAKTHARHSCNGSKISFISIWQASFNNFHMTRVAHVVQEALTNGVFDNLLLLSNKLLISAFHQLFTENLLTSAQ
jgi:hypothetical protein